MLKKTVLFIMILTFTLAQNISANSSKSLISGALPDKPQKPLVIVIVSSSIYAETESSLNQYAEDVENAGFSVNIIETNQLSDKTTQGIRTYLQEATSHNLAGAFFVGDIPEVWYEVGAEKFPTDMYFRDLNGVWTDTDDDGIFDEHSGDISPEIWVGRLKASTISGNEVSLINNYFIKNHRYRNGSRLLPWWRALVYIDDDGVTWTQEAKLSLSQVSSDITLVTDPATTNAEDYKNRLNDPFGYQWLYLMSHGSFDYHVFDIPKQRQGGTVYYHNYRTIDPRIFFYLLFVCSAARYTELEYLAGSVVFTDTYGLLAIGSTDSISSISSSKLFISLSEGKSVGRAFQEWFLEQSGEGQPWEDQDYRIMFYGLTIIGDPTLQPCRRARSVLLRDISITDVMIHLRNSTNGGSVFVTVTVENRGNLTETFDFTIHFYGYAFRSRAHTLVSVSMSLLAKARTTLTYTLTYPYRVSFGNYSGQMIEVRVGGVPEEFNMGDNVKRVYLEGAIISRISPQFSEYSVFFAFPIFVIPPLVFLKVLLSHRPPLMRYLIRMRGYLTKKFFDLKHKLKA